MAKTIESASSNVAMRANAQLEVIVEQMKALQERAREIIEQASRDVDLIHVDCRFHRVPGRIYHLFERADGHRYFSMVGPDEYGRGGPSGFVASFRYEHDESWTRLDEVEARDRRRAEIQGFASNRLLKSSGKS
jgi:alkylation response protein AidB-like acyl-CoA dehydrogenase